MRLYDFYDSGNGYKVRMMLHRLGLAFDYVEVDILKGESRTPEFLTMNPNGKIPVLVLDDGTVLTESNAILFYLAEGSNWLPAERLARARVLEWMFFEQYSHEPAIAVARFWVKHKAMDDALRARLAERIKLGEAALGVMERRLSDHGYLAGQRESVADLALYAYTHVAHEAGFDLMPYPGVRAWLARLAAAPRHVTIGET